MKEKLKKVVMPIFLSVICGAFCGKMVYHIYDQKIEKDLQGEKIYLIQAGAYSTYDNMVKNTSINNYVYYKDNDGLFKSIIGLTEDKANVEKIKNTYPADVIVTEYFSRNTELNQKIKEYDSKIKQTQTEEEIKQIVLEMLSLYKNEKQTLTQNLS